MKLVQDLSAPIHRSKRQRPIVAIDGPAGAGKSTAARLLAHQLSFRMIDTGALYRALALFAMERGLSLKDGPSLALLCEKLQFNFGALERSSDGIPRLPVYVDGIDVTDSIRSAELGMAASNVSKLPEVRLALLEVQREFGNLGGIVMEGRDIGTVIFPDAELKFFLTASVESRAARRFEELKTAGRQTSLEQVVAETQMRDAQDTQREIAPLKRAEHSILVDSTDKSLEDVVDLMASHVRQFLAQHP